MAAPLDDLEPIGHEWPLLVGGRRIIVLQYRLRKPLDHRAVERPTHALRDPTLQILDGRDEQIIEDVSGDLSVADVEVDVAGCDVDTADGESCTAVQPPTQLGAREMLKGLQQRVLPRDGDDARELRRVAKDLSSSAAAASCEAKKSMTWV
jgi:hypothetical protein